MKITTITKISSTGVGVGDIRAAALRVSKVLHDPDRVSSVDVSFTAHRSISGAWNEDKVSAVVKVTENV